MDDRIPNSQTRLKPNVTYQPPSVKVPISDEELARYAKEPGTGTLQDFWKLIGAK
jgi:hypothetical protein